MKFLNLFGKENLYIRKLKVSHSMCLAQKAAVFDQS